MNHCTRGPDPRAHCPLPSQEQQTQLSDKLRMLSEVSWQEMAAEIRLGLKDHRTNLQAAAEASRKVPQLTWQCE